MRPATTVTYQQLHELTKGKYYDELPKAVQQKLETYRPHYKTLWNDQIHNNKILLTFCLVSIVFSSVSVAGSIARNKALIAENTQLKDQIATGLHMAVSYADYTDKLETELASCSAKLPKKKVSTGKVSYYSKLGCIGCNSDQRMANGEIFDEDTNTIAFNKAPLNTWATVTNLDNGRSIQAKVTDRGGFEKYGRIADLSKMVCSFIECKTDKSNIQISWY